jgi:hypothetical protein
MSCSSTKVAKRCNPNPVVVEVLGDTTETYLTDSNGDSLLVALQVGGQGFEFEFNRQEEQL